MVRLSTPSSSSNRNNTKTKGLGRLFKRKQQPLPLCKQDSCSIEDSDDEDHDDLDQDMSNSSSVYSLTSEKENNHGTKSGDGKRTSPKFIDIDSGKLRDLKTLISPSGVNGMPLRKVPISEHLILQARNMRGATGGSSPSSPAAAWFDGGNGTNTAIPNKNDQNDETNGESAFDLNMPQSFSDSEFDIPSFQNLACNPFQPSPSTSWNQSSNDSNRPNTQEENDTNVNDIRGVPAVKDKQKKHGFLKQMKHQFSKSIKRDVSKKDSPVVPMTTTTTTTTISSSTRNDKKGRGLLPPRNSLPTSVPSKNTSNEDQEVPFQVSDETPKFTNKSMNTNGGATTFPSKNAANSSNKSETEKTMFTRAALSRPFGRTSLPSQLAKQWCVEVSPFYDDAEKCWKYCILVQREEYTNKGNTFFSPVKTNNAKTTSSPNCVMQPMDSPSPDMTKSFAAANVTRTLKDIAWLERALRDEYQGALMFPALSMTLTSGTDWTTAVTLDKETFERGEWDPYHLSDELFNVVLEEDEFQEYRVEDEDDRIPPFDPKLISDWFNDVLNGVRGKGELILNYGNSQSVDVMHSESMECFLYKVNESLVDLHFMTKKSSNFNWLPFRLDFGKLTLSESKDENEDFTLMKGLMTFPVMCSCNPSEQVSESDTIMSRRTKYRTKQQSPEYWQKSTLPKELKAQSYYIGIQRENSLMAMYRLRILLETEALVSVAWKRFAISLSNLFTAGKDIESCKVGGSKGKKTVPKISKEKVDDCLRILARQKVDRATPSLKVLSGMLSAYYADFSSVNPSLQAYSDGLNKLESERESITNSGDDNWKQALKAVSPLTLFQDTDDIRDTHALEMEMRAFEQRQIFNENLIKSSIIQLCKSIDVRVSRMSWKFFKMESGQARLLMNAAKQVESMLKDSSESIDLNVLGQEGEVDLVRRILDLGSKRKYKYHPYTKSCSSSHTGSESDLTSENGSVFMEESVTENVSTHNPVVDELIEYVRKCDGCWDSEVAMGILRLAGVGDGEIQVQESTREVRTVQRLADSLRVQIDRCSETLSMLLELAYGVSFQLKECHILDFSPISLNNSFPSRIKLDESSKIVVNFYPICLSSLVVRCIQIIDVNPVIFETVRKF